MVLTFQTILSYATGRGSTKAGWTKNRRCAIHDRTIFKCRGATNIVIRHTIQTIATTTTTATGRCTASAIVVIRNCSTTMCTPGFRRTMSNVCGTIFIRLTQSSTTRSTAPTTQALCTVGDGTIAVGTWDVIGGVLTPRFTRGTKKTVATTGGWSTFRTSTHACLRIDIGTKHVGAEWNIVASWYCSSSIAIRGICTFGSVGGCGWGTDTLYFFRRNKAINVGTVGQT